MATLDEELAQAKAKVEQLKKKQREQKAKQRERFMGAVMTVVDEIENKDKITVSWLLDRAQAMIDEQDAKRREAALRAAQTRREKAQMNQNGSSAGRADEESSHAFGGEG